ncbi:MAG: alpha/beta hydrolase, partial [Pseudomonadota bacterium]
MTKENEFVKDQPQEMPSEGGPLATYRGSRPPAPEWFEAAVSAPYDTEYLEVDGTKIHYQRWGDAKARGLLLVHGNGAHAHWWDFVAPYFAKDYNVVAITLGGMGDSGWRDDYTLDIFSSEQLALMEATGMFAHTRKPIIVAHSFGGFITMNTGAK